MQNKCVYFFLFLKKVSVLQGKLIYDFAKLCKRLAEYEYKKNNIPCRLANYISECLLLRSFFSKQFQVKIQRGNRNRKDDRVSKFPCSFPQEVAILISIHELRQMKAGIHSLMNSIANESLCRLHI